MYVEVIILTVHSCIQAKFTDLENLLKKHLKTPNLTRQMLDKQILPSDIAFVV